MKRTLIKICSLLLLLSLPGKMMAQQAKEEASVYFSFDSYHLDHKGSASLDSLIRILKKDSLFSLTIKGFTDEKGTDEYNLKLAARRAIAVKSYLKKAGIDTVNILSAEAGDNSIYQTLIPDLQRRSVIEINISDKKLYSFYGKQGTEVIADDNDPLQINEFFSAEDMLAYNIYALDLHDQPLLSDGMISICSYGIQKDKSGKFYIIKIPIRDIRRASNMKVWAARADSGQVRWKETGVTVDLDLVNKQYVFKYPVPTGKGSAAGGCIYINMDVYCEGACFVYITTWKKIPFTNVNLEYARFTAKLNDSTYVFRKDDPGNSKGDHRIFKSYEGQDVSLAADLDDCYYSKDSVGNEHYYLCDTCMIRTPVAAPVPEIKETKAPVKKKKRRNFFQRIGDFFSGKN